ncbi:aspartate--tRNA ligase [Roseobacter sp. N2S]|uniref:aspartate--tRNA ligase n=1 Tax=Roseobacter sp. N2S TaxID=2663844 RepID=UPI00285A222A|nr:aspartate--tRNA ligase [Roseobacter sp. N2S]MDR6264066.1 aspartyl-tRNA synthetase [Roseobacter sp. N2S]
MHAYRSHTCSELNASNVGDTVRLSGWVHRVRDHGGILFIDLRDHYGMTQVLADPDSPVFKDIEKVRSEWVIRIDGEVMARAPELVNPKLPTGEVEVFIRDIEVLGEAAELPLPVFGDQDYPEETRLKYRFIDLRRESLHENIMMRSKVVSSIRKRMEGQGFNEFQTPIITASSPEGARDFLVPSRLHPGKFYALPQAPQQFKQLIMVAGFDKYFQIAPCFRDEDPRADRSPTDFYQLDMEMSFVSQQDVFDTIEPVLKGVMEEFGKGRPVNQDWPQISYKDAALWYGSDKPDLRNPIKMQVVSDHFAGSGFKIFASLLENEGTEVRAIPAPTGGSRKFCDRMNKFAQQEGLPGMGYIFWRKRNDEPTEIDLKMIEWSVNKLRDEGASDADIEAHKSFLHRMEAAGPLAKNIGPERTEAIRQQLGLGVGDAAFFLGGKPSAFEGVAGRARNVIGEELGLTDKEKFEFCWIVDFPMYEKDEQTGKIDFSHNPFSMPQGGMADLENKDPLDVLGYQYDLACNGYELISGAIRNHKPEIMYKAFEIAGYPNEEVDKRFGGMVNAFTYGAPPHGGCATGIDRLVMLLADENNIRQVIMFPMNQRAEDLMLGGPSEPTNEQLRELGLRVLPQDS